MKRVRHIALACLLTLAPLASAQQQPSDGQKPAPGLVLRELLVVQADRYEDIANSPQLIKTALPTAIKKSGREKKADTNEQFQYEPMPLGVLTFEGEIDQPMHVRIQLPDAGSRFQAFFPSKDAIAGKQLLEWETVRQANDQQRAESFGDQGKWLEQLRESEDRLWLQSREPNSKERFLFYDASFTYKPTLELGLKSDQFILTSSTPELAAPPITLLLQKKDIGWVADELAAPWGQPSLPIAQKLKLDQAGTTLDEALVPIKDLLTTRGYNSNEVGLALAMIASAGLDQSSMSLVYVLPDGVIDEYVRLRIKPEPDQIVRTAIVIVNNVDPELGSRIEDLLDDLGSVQWIVRDRAQQRLIELKQAAVDQVRPLLNSKDPEVAFRAQQILDAYEWERNPNK